MARVISRALTRSGWQCETVDCGEAAYSRICRKSFDVIVSDMAMPEMTGLELLDRVVAIRPETRVILISGDSSVDSAKQAMRRGAYDYLEKPFEINELKRVVDEAIADRQGESGEEELPRGTRNRNGSPPAMIHRDSLTGLMSHRRFQEDIARMRANCRGQTRTLSMVLIDIDDFTRINTEHGYAFGDYVLRELANGLRTVCRESDVLARYGGQKFAIALFDSNCRQATAVAHRIRNLVRTLPFSYKDRSIQIGVCIGVAQSDPGFIEAESELIDRTRQALAQAKKSGGNSVISWDELTKSPPQDQHLDRNSLEGMMEQFDRLNQQLKKSCAESTVALIAAVEAKDPYTKRHSVNVATFAAAIGRRLGVDKTMIETLETAAMLHDIGKIGIPDRILTKQGPLTEEEVLLVRRHPLTGVEILKYISFLKNELPMILHHHEWWDGTGYPEGLAGESIPMGARILHVADAVEAMLATRSYKDSYPVERVAAELSSGLGVQFDPEICRTALKWLEEDPDQVLAAIEAGHGVAMSPESSLKVIVAGGGGTAPQLEATSAPRVQ